MTFLAPAALIGILLLAIPILVHLFKPRKMRRTPLSSLRWLKQTHQRLSRRIRWHQWLLFLMRAGVITLLVLALAKPLVGTRGDAPPTDRFVILDVGPTMDYEEAGALTPLTRGKEIAEKIARHGRPGDRTALLVAGAAPRIITRPSADVEPHLATLRTIQAQEGAQPLTSALPLVAALTGAAERETELIFISDLRRPSWRQDEIQTFVKSLSAPARVQVIDVGPGAASNAWIAGARVIDLGPGEGRLVRVELGCVGEEKQERRLRLCGIADVPEQVQSVTLLAGQVARLDFKIPSSGGTAELRLEPPDALPSDDRWYLSLDASFAERILLLEAPDSPDGRGPALFVRAGLEALAESNNQALKIERRSSKSVAPADVQEADLVVLAGVPELPGAVLETLEQQVRGGAGAIFFLGDGLNLSFYRDKLHRALQPNEGLLPSPLAGSDAWRGGLGILTDVDWSHPLFGPLSDPVQSDLRQARFRRHATWVGMPSPPDRVLARIDGAQPALIDHPLGAGRVLIWNTTADDAWSDLPRRRAFVPLLDRMLSYLGDRARREFTVGEPLNLPLADDRPEEPVTVVGPDGAAIPAKVLRHGAKAVLHLDRIDRAGAYKVQHAGKTQVFTVNGSRTASNLASLDAKILEAWWAPVPVEVLSMEGAQERAAAATAWPLWPTLIFLGGVLLLAETIYVYRLCPRRDPSVVESIVPQRGVLQALQKPVA